ncbi:MAG: hypothetical protein U1E51_28215 [Candidatus Binatia bacterium]|nr:hypothetical protein [Candidatus Binatia bacterium]
MTSPKSSPSQVTPSPPLVVRIRGLGNVIPFKNRKRISGNRLITEPHVKKQMQAMTDSFVLQLLSECQTREGATSTECLRRFLIACVPQDDAWTYIPEIVIKGELVPTGEEGADVLIEQVLFLL